MTLKILVNYFWSNFLFTVQLSSLGIGISLCTFTCITSPIITSATRGGHLLQFMYIDTVHPMSIVYVRVHLSAMNSKGFGHMYNDMYGALYYHVQWFQCFKNLLYSTSSSFPVLLLLLATTEFFLLYL